LDVEEGAEVSNFLLVFKSRSRERKCFCEWQSDPDTAALWGTEKVTFICRVTLIIPGGWSTLFTEDCVFRGQHTGNFVWQLALQASRNSQAFLKQCPIILAAEI